MKPSGGELETPYFGVTFEELGDLLCNPRRGIGEVLRARVELLWLIGIVGEGVKRSP